MRTNVHTLSVWEMHHAGLKKHIKGKGKMIRGFLLCVCVEFNGNDLLERKQPLWQLYPKYIFRPVFYDTLSFTSLVILVHHKPPTKFLKIACLFQQNPSAPS